MSDLVPFDQDAPVPLRGGRLSRQTKRTLQTLEQRTLLRMAGVQAEGVVQGEKMREVDRVTRSAMGGQAMLRSWAATLSTNDPFLVDEMNYFASIARMGKAEILMNLVDKYNRER